MSLTLTRNVLGRERADAVGVIEGLYPRLPEVGLTLGMSSV